MPNEVRPVRWVIEELRKRWPGATGWVQDAAATPSEAKALSLDSALATRFLRWHPRLPLESALGWTVAWYRAHREGSDMRDYSLAEIQRYRELGA